MRSMTHLGLNLVSILRTIITTTNNTVPATRVCLAHVSFRLHAEKVKGLSHLLPVRTIKIPGCSRCKVREISRWVIIGFLVSTTVVHPECGTMRHGAYV